MDVTGKLPGRGAYICLNLECLRRAKKSGALARALKTTLSEECWTELERCICSYAEEHSPEERLKELRSLLGLARRSGLIEIGTDSVKAGAERPLLLLTARDCSESVAEFVAGMTDPTRQGAGHEHSPLPLDKEAVSAALGAGGVQIVALPARSGLADKIKVLLAGSGSWPEDR